MLVITRGDNKGIWLETSDGPIHLVVLGFYESDQGNPRVRLGIEAPQLVKIWRDELRPAPDEEPRIPARLLGEEGQQ